MGSFKIDESVFETLAEILKKHGLSEIEYKDGDAKIRIASFSSNQSSQENVRYVNVAQSQNFAPTENISEKPSDFENHKGALKSPMVGMCYLAPEPGASNFVSIGDMVQEGQPVLVIEAMKVMNLIKAHKSGKVVHIAVNNSDPVEYGQLLLVIE